MSENVRKVRTKPASRSKHEIMLMKSKLVMVKASERSTYQWYIGHSLTYYLNLYEKKCSFVKSVLHVGYFPNQFNVL